MVVHGSAAPASLTLPGETAAWYESTIYARVSGYVAKWYVDIGDQRQGRAGAGDDRHAGTGCRACWPRKAKLQAAQAQVKVKQADAAFAASTYARWRDSPKGVVSEQEREDKKAGDAAAAAQLEAARAQVNARSGGCRSPVGVRAIQARHGALRRHHHRAAHRHRQSGHRRQLGQHDVALSHGAG